MSTTSIKAALMLAPQNNVSTTDIETALKLVARGSSKRAGADRGSEPELGEHAELRPHGRGGLLGAVLVSRVSVRVRLALVTPLLPRLFLPSPLPLQNGNGVTFPEEMVVSGPKRRWNSLRL